METSEINSFECAGCNLPHDKASSNPYLLIKMPGKRYEWIFFCLKCDPGPPDDEGGLAGMVKGLIKLWKS